MPAGWSDIWRTDDCLTRRNLHQSVRFPKVLLRIRGRQVLNVHVRKEPASRSNYHELSIWLGSRTVQGTFWFLSSFQC